MNYDFKEIEPVKKYSPYYSKLIRSQQYASLNVLRPLKNRNGSFPELAAPKMEYFFAKKRF
jgi:hypothetical protein